MPFVGGKNRYIKSFIIQNCFGGNKMSKSDTIETRNEKLLKKEKLYRKTNKIYKSSLGFFATIFIGALLLSFYKKILLDETYILGIFIILILCLFVFYETHLKIGHIESIKYYKSILNDSVNSQ